MRLLPFGGRFPPGALTSRGFGDTGNGAEAGVPHKSRALCHCLD